MLTYYQPFLLPFLRLERYTFSNNVKRAFFISFEDALWNLLHSQNIPLKSVIFIPDFYCMDVVQNIKNHGYVPVYYPLDDQFQLKKREFESLRRRYAPKVIIFFHACGIQQRILNDTRYIRRLANHTLIIEDAVQRLLNPEHVRMLHPNHVVMDSLRKTSPLHGSFIYGKTNIIQSLPYPSTSEFRYQIQTIILFILFRFVFVIGVLLRSNTIVRYAHKIILQYHDDIIGDSKEGHRGLWHIPVIHSFFNFSTIESTKKKQVTQYKKLLHTSMSHNSHMYPFHIPDEQYGSLHVFPVGYNLTDDFTESTINTYIEKSGYPIWTKFPDCPWSRKRAVLFLPLGFHVRYNEIKDICNVVNRI